MKLANHKAGKIKTKSEILCILEQRFNIVGCSVQIVSNNNAAGGLYLLEHIDIGRRLTLAGVERLVRRIAKALDGEPYGTVNIDYFSLGGDVTFDMVVEAGS